MREMADVFGYHNREVVRIKVKKCDGLMQPEYKKFSVDPQITSHDVLQNLLLRAFDIKGNFTISYLTKDPRGQEVYTTMLSDWDLDAAFLSASDPCLRLKVDLKPFEEGLDDWDIVGTNDVTKMSQRGAPAPSNDRAVTFLGNLTETLSTQFERTMTTMQRAVGGLRQQEDEMYRPSKPPLSDAEFHSYMDMDGHLIRPQEFRLSIYKGGVEPSLRRVVWRHLLNVYPDGLTGLERFAFIKAKSEEYYQMRDRWRAEYKRIDSSDEDLKFIVNMVKKDVLRTDRTHPYYAGSDDNTNVLTLLNILVTYAITHPSVSYCQGMSDLASPILVVQDDEAQAYICFCALMRRLKNNFHMDGYAMSMKFQHLAELLGTQDPEYFNYLHTQGADDLLFSYRWLLLEMKREFPFDDALYMLEILWSSLPPNPPTSDLDMVEKFADPAKLSQTRRGSLQRQETAYLRVRSLRRQATSPVAKEAPASIPEVDESGAFTPVEEEKSFDHSPDYETMEDSMTSSILRKASSIDRSLEGAEDVSTRETLDDESTNEEKEFTANQSAVSDAPTNRVLQKQSAITEEPKKEVWQPINTGSPTKSPKRTRETKEAKPLIDFVKVKERLPKLPSPGDFGYGNPFLMFLSVTMLLQPRDSIISQNMDYNDIAMHFDKMTRKHNVHKVVSQAQSMYAVYLKAQAQKQDELAENGSDYDVSV